LNYQWILNVTILMVCALFSHIILLIKLNSRWILCALFLHIRCWWNWIFDGFFMLCFCTFIVDRIEFSMDSKWDHVDGLCSIFAHYLLVNPSYVIIQASLVDYKFCLASSMVTYSATYISIDVSAWHPLR